MAARCGDHRATKPVTADPPALFSTLGEIPYRWRRDDPDATALITTDRIFTAAELGDLVDEQVHALQRLTPPGARIGVHASNSAAFVALLYAVPAARRVLVPLNVRSTAPDLVDQLDRTDAALLVGDPVAGFTGPTIPLDDLAEAESPDVAADASAPRVDDETDRHGGAGGDSHTSTLHDSRAPGSDDVAWIIFTSGSTGRPKGVLLTHASLAAAVATTAAARPLADDEVYLYPFPLFHVAAYNVVHAHARRRPVVLPDRFDPRRIIELCHAHRVTAMSLAATMLRMVLDALADDASLQPPPSLRTVAYGAAPMPEPLLREAHRVIGCAFAQGYGSTELSGNAVFLGPDAHRRGLAGEARLLRAAGYPGPGVELDIVDDHGDPVAPGSRGEILVRASQVCAGYLDDPVATAEAIGDRWLHTGDIGTLDDDGLLHIVDRAKDIVVTGGENVASRTVEDALCSHPKVADVAVVGLPDPRWGEAVTAVVVLDAGGSDPEDRFRPAPEELTAELADHVSERLAGFMKPKQVFIGTALPHNANGKVDKPRIRSLLAESTGSTRHP